MLSPLVSRRGAQPQRQSADESAASETVGCQSSVTPLITVLKTRLPAQSRATTPRPTSRLGPARGGRTRGRDRRTTRSRHPRRRDRDQGPCTRHPPTVRRWRAVNDGHGSAPNGPVAPARRRHRRHRVVRPAKAYRRPGRLERLSRRVADLCVSQSSSHLAWSAGTDRFGLPMPETRTAPSRPVPRGSADQRTRCRERRACRRRATGRGGTPRAGARRRVSANATAWPIEL